MRIPGLSRLIDQAHSIAHSRSSVLVPLQWSALIFGCLLVFLVALKASLWLQIGSFVIFASNAALILAAYVLFGLRNSDALRSEHHSLSKMAMEKGLFGDSDSKLIEVDRVAPVLDKGQSSRYLESKQEIQS